MNSSPPRGMSVTNSTHHEPPGRAVRVLVRPAQCPPASLSRSWAAGWPRCPGELRLWRRSWQGIEETGRRRTGRLGLLRLSSDIFSSRKYSARSRARSAVILVASSELANKTIRGYRRRNPNHAQAHVTPTRSSWSRSQSDLWGFNVSEDRNNPLPHIALSTTAPKSVYGKTTPQGTHLASELGEHQVPGQTGMAVPRVAGCDFRRSRITRSVIAQKAAALRHDDRPMAGIVGMTRHKRVISCRASASWLR